MGSEGNREEDGGRIGCARKEEESQPHQPSVRYGWGSNERRKNGGKAEGWDSFFSV